MSIYDEVKSNIMRQELQLIEAGQHYKIYSAKVKYLPTNIEKPDFFRLCYGMLTKCDEINVYTFKKDTYEVLYKYIVTNVDIENKIVDVVQVMKVDFLENKTIIVETTEASSVNEDLSGEKEGPITVTLEEVQKLVDEKVTELKTEVDTLNEKLEAFIGTTTQYQTDTDDQLEEIEAKLEGLENGKESTKTETTETNGKSKNANAKNGQ